MARCGELNDSEVSLVRYRGVAQRSGFTGVAKVREIGSFIRELQSKTEGLTVKLEFRLGLKIIRAGIEVKMEPSL